MPRRGHARAPRRASRQDHEGRRQNPDRRAGGVEDHAAPHLRAAESRNRRPTERRAMRAALLLIAVAACSESQATSASPQDVPAIVLLARAERLRLEWTPNYDHPIVDTDDTIERSEDLYIRACEEGASFACWHSPGGERVLLEMCRAGDMVSCRGFTDQAPTVRAFRDLPGTAARNYRWGARKAVRMADL